MMFELWLEFEAFLSLSFYISSVLPKWIHSDFHLAFSKNVKEFKFNFVAIETFKF